MVTPESEGGFKALNRHSPCCWPETGFDPKETPAIRGTTAAMKPRGDIAGIVILVTDAADHARRRTADHTRRL